MLSKRLINARGKKNLLPLHANPALSEPCVVTHKKYCLMTQIISHSLGKVERYLYIYIILLLFELQRLLRVDLLAK